MGKSFTVHPGPWKLTECAPACSRERRLVSLLAEQFKGCKRKGNSSVASLFYNFLCATSCSACKSHPLNCIKLPGHMHFPSSSMYHLTLLTSPKFLDFFGTSCWSQRSPRTRSQCWPASSLCSLETRPKTLQICTFLLNSIHCIIAFSKGGRVHFYRKHFHLQFGLRDLPGQKTSANLPSFLRNLIFAGHSPSHTFSIVESRQLYLTEKEV